MLRLTVVERGAAGEVMMETDDWGVGGGGNGIGDRSGHLLMSNPSRIDDYSHLAPIYLFKSSRISKS